MRKQKIGSLSTEVRCKRSPLFVVACQLKKSVWFIFILEKYLLSKFVARMRNRRAEGYFIVDKCGGKMSDCIKTRRWPALGINIQLTPRNSDTSFVRLVWIIAGFQAYVKWIVIFFQKLLVDFYRNAPDLVKFNKVWALSMTYLEKVKVWNIDEKLPCLELMK